MSTPYEAYRQELAALLELLLAGRLADNLAIVERHVVRMVDAQLRALELHPVDDEGWCPTCWRASRRWWSPWPKRTTCTMYAALGFDPPHPETFDLSAITAKAAIARSAS